MGDKNSYWVELICCVSEKKTKKNTAKKARRLDDWGLRTCCLLKEDVIGVIGVIGRMKKRHFIVLVRVRKGGDKQRQLLKMFLSWTTVVECCFLSCVIGFIELYLWPAAVCIHCMYRSFTVKCILLQ